VSILQRYLATNLVKGWLAVLLVLGTVFGLVNLIQELDHIRFNYDATQVVRFVLMSLPQRLMDLAPVIALLGTIFALAGLDRSNELAIISCAGVPVRQLLGALALPTVLLVGLLWGSMEFVTAPLHQNAEQQRTLMRARNTELIPNGGVWSRQGNRYIHVRRMLEENVPGDISLYEFNDRGELQRALHAQQAQVDRNRRWLFQRVKEKVFVDGHPQTRWLAELEIANLWAASELPTLSLSSDSMPLSVLYGYSQYLRDNGQPYENHLNAFWQKIAMPLTVAAMVLLATPISASLGSRRERNFGVSMGIGALVGILFYLGAQIVFAVGRIMQWHGLLVAVLPATLVACCAVFLIYRMRW
jgi:lipopolysaccharide export system permease protein